ncbi:MAG: hypothetical protein V4610_18240 [Pseudomonadota bacterium]
MSPGHVAAVRLKLGAEYVVTRNMAGGWTNVVIGIKEKGMAESLAAYVMEHELSSKVDVFVSLLPLDDSGIKKVPDHVCAFLRETECEMMISYTFLES